MKVKVSNKDPNSVRDYFQDELMLKLAETAESFLKSSEIKKENLDDTTKMDIFCGALLTLFTKNLGYVAAAEDTFEHEKYLQGVFDSMAQLFQQARQEFSELLRAEEKHSLDGKKDSGVH